MTNFYEQTARGDALGAISTAASFSALWAIGSAWSNAIRAISLELFPHATMDIVLAEVMAATITTLLGLGVAFTVARSWRRCCTSSCKSRTQFVTEQSGPMTNTTPRLQTIVNRP
ncbi:MAG: hypothetical protein CBC12_07610 [Candidatus Puniceispirillum sp. TMED52]|nr:MAG: hypothetical protein CBC12_07610 [Candidatus Puniceispirillum sp. TMED52]RPF82055.1 MAG: hypothetical protein CBC65_001600 [Rhodothermaceae bacterium TMED105]